MQYIGVFFISAGMVAILANKFEYNKSFIPSTLHSVLGVCTLLLIVIQVYIGMEKMTSPVKVRRWHGNAGLLTWDVSILTILLGMIQFLTITWLVLLAGMILCLVWAAVHLQFRADNPSTGMTDSEEGYEVGGGGLLIADHGESSI